MPAPPHESLIALSHRPPILGYLATYLFVFGAVTLAGGVIGFVKAKSRASLIAGSVSGALLFIAGWLTHNASSPAALRIGMVLGLIVSVALLGRFGVAFKKTRKVMPAGVITLLSVGAVALSVAALLDA